MYHFVALTGYLPQTLVIRRRIWYADKEKQGLRIREPSIVISNHTSVWDMVAYFSLFRPRLLRFLTAEIMFQRGALFSLFLRSIGCIRVDRYARDMSFIEASVSALERGDSICVFPESRLPREGETPPLPFSCGAAYIAMRSAAPILPIYTDGAYFLKKRPNIVVGTPFEITDISESQESEREKIELINRRFENKIYSLKEHIEN
jgi:1-acyl-sn-glycerol-3-phosphate acyltransferase